MKKFRVESMSGPISVFQEVIEAESHQHALQQLVESEARKGVLGTGGFCHLDPKNDSYPKNAITVVLTVWEADEDDELGGE
jgi:dihydroorotase